MTSMEKLCSQAVANSPLPAFLSSGYQCFYGKQAMSKGALLLATEFLQQRYAALRVQYRSGVLTNQRRESNDPHLPNHFGIP